LASATGKSEADMAATKITTAGFLSEFLARHQKMADRPFCWVLGSGASFQSGIPTGDTFAMQWLKDIHEADDFNNLLLDQWATATNLGIKDFDFKRAASFYPFIYQRRFRGYKDLGYAFLEAAMAGVEPSYGYSVLAQIMANHQHKVAVTTNFDNLIADAISIYSNTFPLVCGHESLTGFVRPNLKRPVIAKIHRDLLLNPKSEWKEIEKLPREWKEALKAIFENNTPIVIGYGGNDGSLMGFLKKIPPIKGGIFWCYQTGNEPDQKIQKIVERHDGRLVPVLGFDELMFELWEKLKLSFPIPELQNTHEKRKGAFLRQFEELKEKITKHAANKIVEAELKEVRTVAAAAIERLTSNLKRHLPGHLTDNISSKCFVFRHPNLFEHKSVVFSYAHNQDKQVIREKAINFAVKMNEALGPVPPRSPEGRMSSRNKSGIVGVYPKRSLAKRNGLYYYSWAARWNGCPFPGGISWPCIEWTDNGAYILAELSRKMRPTNRDGARDRVIEEYEKIKGTPESREILRSRPKIPIEDLFPDKNL
jgi:hypothetical protein